MFVAIRGPDEYVPPLRSLVDLAPDLDARLQHVDLCERGYFIVYTWQGTHHGGKFELPKVAVTEIDGDGKVCRIDQCDRDQLDAACARYDELAKPKPSAPPIENTVTRTLARSRDAWAAQDQERFAANQLAQLDPTRATAEGDRE